MAKHSSAEQLSSQFAPLSNVALAQSMMETLAGRDAGLPGIGVLYGASGLGKSSAASYLANPNAYNAAYVSCRVFETTKSLAESLCTELGLTSARGTIAKLVDEITKEVGASSRALVIDEVDRIVESRALELIRDIHDQVGCAVILIGEQNFDAKLKRHERFDNRVLVWQPASYCTPRDFDALLRHYVPGITVDADLKKRVLSESGAVTRRVVVNLQNIKRWCQQQGVSAAGADYAGQLYTGQAPRAGGVR